MGAPRAAAVDGNKPQRCTNLLSFARFDRKLSNPGPARSPPPWIVASGTLVCARPADLLRLRCTPQPPVGAILNGGAHGDERRLRAAPRRAAASRTGAYSRYA